jgi:hypothetical protein
VLQYLLNTISVTSGTTLFGQRLAGLISPFLSSSSVTMMSPSNLPLRSHALRNSVTSVTKHNGNLLCVATGCSSCKISPAILVEHLYTSLMDFVEWISVLNCTEAHGGFLD